MKVRYTPRARADLKAIHEYIARDDRRAAERVVVAIRRAAHLIAKDPTRGHSTESPEILRVPVIRYPYALYFSALDNWVYIVHVRHSSRRWPTASEL